MPQKPEVQPLAKVLLVDDEEAFRRNLQTGLEDLGYAVVVARDGREGWEVFCRGAFDIVLVDLGMPTMSGLELVIALRERSPFTPVVIVSGSGTLLDAIEVIRRGAWDYVVKPVEQADQLDLVMRRNLERARLLTENHAHKTQLEALVAERTRRLRENEEQLRVLGDNLPNGMVYQVVRETDGRMRFLYVSAGVERLHGVSAEAALRDSTLLYEQVLAEDRPAVAAAEAASLASMSVYNVVARFQAPGGPVRWMHLNSAPRRLPDGRVVWDGIETDITERKQAEEKQKFLEAQLRQSQKLEALGTLAGGIAHDFNNILTAIISFAELSRLENPDNPALQENLGEVVAAGNRATGLVRQILSFSRQQKQERRSVQLTPVVREAMKLMRSTLPSTIEIATAIAPALPDVLADPTQMHQVIMNLCTNAAHAMKDRSGRLTVLLDRVRVTEDAPKPCAELWAGEYVRLLVRDTGHGIDSETRKRIFEPFFTTKPTGEGTGLGLSVVHGIVQDHDGAIAVESEPGQGTAFAIFLPAINAVETARAETRSEVSAGKGQRVLFVDDEPALCAVAEKMISRLGYQPVVFSNPAEAWAALQKEPLGFDLVVTDLTMPGMTGIELARRVFGVRPTMPVILTSGYTASLSAESVRELGIRELLHKPLDIQTLALALNRVLKSRPGDRTA